MFPTRFAADTRISPQNSTWGPGAELNLSPLSSSDGLLHATHDVSMPMKVKRLYPYLDRTQLIYIL